MHIKKTAIRGAFVAVALFTLSVPLAHRVVLAKPAHMGNPTQPASSIAIGGGSCAAYTSANCYVFAGTDQAQNSPYPHSVFFQCGSATGAAPAGAPINDRASANTDVSGGRVNSYFGIRPSCYDVTASVNDVAGGSQTFASARCGNIAVDVMGSVANCSGYLRALCPLGSMSIVPSSRDCAIADGNALDANSSTSRVQVAVNPATLGARPFMVTFTGYTPMLAPCDFATSYTGRGVCSLLYGSPAGTPTDACPAGLSYVNGPVWFTATAAPAAQSNEYAPDGLCRFTISIKTS